MKGQKVFIGGWVAAPLKRQFLEQLRSLNAKMSPAGFNGKITQSDFLEILLTESITARNKKTKKRGRKAAVFRRSNGKMAGL